MSTLIFQAVTKKKDANIINCFWTDNIIAVEEACLYEPLSSAWNRVWVIFSLGTSISVLIICINAVHSLMLW